MIKEFQIGITEYLVTDCFKRNENFASNRITCDKKEILWLGQTKYSHSRKLLENFFNPTVSI